MSVTYRSVLEGDPSEVTVEAITKIMNSWCLGKKHWDTGFPDSSGTVVAAGGQELTTTIFDSRAVKAYRWTAREKWDTPPWFEQYAERTEVGITDVTLVITSDKAFLWTEIDSPHVVAEDGKHLDLYARVPGFVRKALNTLPLRNGLGDVFTQPTIIQSASHLDELFAALEDESRLAPVLVTAPPADGKEGLENWVEKIEILTRRTIGMQSVYVLTAHQRFAFNERAGFGHSVQAGGLRTFLPHVEFGDPENAYLHRAVFSKTLSEALSDKSFGRQLQQTIARGVIRSLNRRTLPAVVVQSDREILRRNRRRPIEALRERLSPTSISEHPEFLKQKQEWEEIAEDFAGKADVAEEEVATLTDRVLGVEEDRDLLYEELLTAEKNQTYLNDVIHSLRLRLNKLGRGQEAYAEPEQLTSLPDTFNELISMARQKLSHISFVGNPATNRKLIADMDSQAKATVALQKAWRALSTMNYYAEAVQKEGFEGNLGHYVDGRGKPEEVQFSAFVFTESKSVKQDTTMRAQRTVKVPATVKDAQSDGSLMMVAHARLAQGANCPRMYFYDNVSADGKIYVGHIGAHPKNTLTN